MYKLELFQDCNQKAKNYELELQNTVLAKQKHEDIISVGFEINNNCISVMFSLSFQLESSCKALIIEVLNAAFVGSPR